MLHEVIEVLVRSENAAADDVLLEALRLGNEEEKQTALSALLRRKRDAGLSGIVAQYGDLPQPVQLVVLENVRLFRTALRDCVRSKTPATAIAAMKLVALGRQGKLAYALIECIHGPDEAVSRGAVEAIVALARWIATETRKLQRTEIPAGDAEQLEQRQAVYEHLMEDRPEVEQSVARAMEVHRGKYGPDLLRAALLLADWPGSKTLAMVSTPRHGGQTALVRRLQQSPDSENVDAFLLAATHHNLRSNFGVVVSHVADPPVLDALLRRTHWLKDHRLQLAMHQVSRGVWWGDEQFEKDLARRDDDDAAKIGEWIAASGIHDVVQDERLDRLRTHLTPHFPGRLRLLRVAMRRPRGASVSLLRTLLSDPDERIVRMAARDLVRRRPPDMDQILIQLMTVAPESVRRVIGRSVGQVGFDSFWNRYDRLDKATRRNAGRAMFKILPDALQRLERRIRGGVADQRLKGMTMAQELGVAEMLASVLLQACHDPAPKIRSKAVAVLATINVVPPEQLLDKVLNDNDPRVRANAIEVLEAKHRVEFVPMLAQRARTSSNRERANAIKALHRMKVGSTSQQLLSMIRDDRAEHRLSALWALRQIGWWQLLNEVVGVAKADPSLKVRRYAMAVIRDLADTVPGRNKEGSGVRVQGSGAGTRASIADRKSQSANPVNPEPRKAAG